MEAPVVVGDLTDKEKIYWSWSHEATSFTRSVVFELLHEIQTLRNALKEYQR